MPERAENRRAEWRWVAAWAAVVLALVALPYAVALLRPPEGRLLAMTLYYGVDIPNYLAAMGDGRASGSWLVTNHFTSESHRPAFMFPFYVLLGKVAGLLGLDLAPVLAAAMVGAGIALVFASYAFVSTFTEEISRRRLGFLFILFASGLGIWVAAAVPATGPVEAPTRGFSFERAEVSTYLLFFGPPHLTLALALILAWGRALALWSWCGRPRHLAMLALVGLGVGLLNAFSLLSLVAVAGAHALAGWVSARRFPRREAAAAVLLAAVLAPLLANSLLTFALDPFWTAAYNRQNPVGSPLPWMLAFDFGVLLLLAAAGLARGSGRGEARLLLAAWILALAVLIYLPVPFQRRFGYGLQPAIAALAALGAGGIAEHLRASPALRRWRLPSLAALATLAFSGTMLGLAILVMATTGRGGLGRIAFEPVETAVAAEWLAGRSGETDVVLSSLETGNYLGGRIRGRVVLGHPGVTLDPRRKEEMVRAFFGATATPEDRGRVVADEGVTMVFLGQRERDMGGRPLPAGEGFEPVYEAGGVQVYRVAR